MRLFIARAAWIVVVCMFASVVSAQELEPLRTFVSIDAMTAPTIDATTLVMPQTMSEQGIEVLKSFESFNSRAYPDAGGGHSIGYGFQTWRGRRVTATYPGRITRAQGNAEFRRQLSLYEDIVREMGTFPQEAFDAFVSIAYNAGRLNTTICRKIINQKPITIHDFLSTAKVFNKVDWRLQGRRTREFYMLLGDYDSARMPVESPNEVRSTMRVLAKHSITLR